MSDEVSNRVRELLTAHAEHLHGQHIQLEHVLAEIGIDSLELLSLACDVEGAFSVQVSDDELSLTRTMGDLVRLITQKISA